MNMLLCIIKTYLPKQGTQDVALEIHQENLASTLGVIVVDAIDKIAMRIIDSEAIAIEHKRFHPHCV